MRTGRSWAGVTLLQNQRVTHSWTTLPEMLSQYQYGVPASLTFQADPVPHRELTPQQALEYKAQLSFRSGSETLASYLTRLEYRVRYYRFFFLAPLYVALPFFFLRIREYPYLWVTVTLLLFALGVNFSRPSIPLHCRAHLPLRSGQRHGPRAAGRLTIRGYDVGAGATRLIVSLCVAHFVLWYGVHLFEGFDPAATLAGTKPGTRSIIESGAQNSDQSRAGATARQQLVFVRYSPRHLFPGRVGL